MYALSLMRFRYRHINMYIYITIPVYTEVLLDCTPAKEKLFTLWLNYVVLDALHVQIGFS